MADGTVTAILGYNFYGGPNVPPGLTNVVAVAAGDNHNLALVGDGPPVFQAPFVLNPAWDTNGFRAFNNSSAICTALSAAPLSS